VRNFFLKKAGMILTMGEPERQINAVIISPVGGFSVREAF